MRGTLNYQDLKQRIIVIANELLTVTWKRSALVCGFWVLHSIPFTVKPLVAKIALDI